MSELFKLVDISEVQLVNPPPSLFRNKVFVALDNTGLREDRIYHLTTPEYVKFRDFAFDVVKAYLYLRFGEEWVILADSAHYTNASVVSISFNPVSQRGAMLTHNFIFRCEYTGDQWELLMGPGR